MNKTLLVGGLAALTLAAGGAAFAQSSPERPQARLHADADGDHRLSQAEFVGRRLGRLTAADADSDGAVTAEERRAAAQARRASRADARFDRLDADDDGVISKAEFDARREHRAERGPRRAHRGPAARHVRRDRRTDARGPVVIAEVRARTEAAFARLDADHDGYVTADERHAGVAQRREHRRERREERRMARHARQASPPTPASE
jgi:hypothetical protein